MEDKHQSVLTETKYGLFDTFGEKDLISLSLIKYGEWAINEIFIMSKFIKKGDIVLDVGANLGCFSCEFSSIVGKTGKVICFEPHDLIFKKLEKNTKKFSNISLNNYGLHSSNGKYELVENFENFGASSIDLTECNIDGSSFKRLDSLDLDRVDFIKMDIEGNEINALRGSCKTLKNFKPNIALEVNTLEKANEIFDFLINLGYECFGINSKAFNPNNFKKNNKNIFNQYTEISIIAIHSDNLNENMEILLKLSLKKINGLDSLIKLFLEKPQFLEEIKIQYLEDLKSKNISYNDQIKSLQNDIEHRDNIILDYRNSKDLVNGLLKDVEHRDNLIKKIRDEEYKFNLDIKQKENLIASLKKDIEHRNNLINNFKKDIDKFNNNLEHKDNEIIYLKKDIEHRNNLINNFKKDIEHSDNLINNFKKDIEHRDNLINDLNQDVGKFSNNLEHKDNEILYFKKDIEHRDNLINDLNQDIDKFNNNLEHKDNEIIYLKKDIEHRNNLINNYKKDIEHRNNLINNFKKDIEHRDNLINDINYENYLLKNNNNQITNSRSYRYTYFLRYIFYKLRSIKKAIMRKKSYPVRSKYIIVPVYADTQLTKKCLDAAIVDISLTKNAYMLIINDCGPEEDMQKMLEDFQKDWDNKVKLIKNDTNLGFVKSVNKGFNYDLSSDVILLNSDVLTPKSWLKRLTQEAYEEDNIGTVTPLSNNTTICTFPEFLQENNHFSLYGVDSIDEAFSLNKIKSIEAPTGIGFCMYVKRDCLNQIGFFNDDKFPIGYGEENDLCQRALKKGWKNIISPNLYVYHKGGVSFQQKRQKLIERANITLDKLYPNYHKNVSDFIKNDPLKKARILRIVQFLSIKKIRKIMHILPEMTGGVLTHVEELTDYLNKKNNVFAIIVFRKSDHEYRVRFGANNNSDELILREESSDFKKLICLIETLGINFIHYHHTKDFSKELLNLGITLMIPYAFTFHDYFLICGNPTLTNFRGVYTTNEEEWGENELYPKELNITDSEWREKFIQFLNNAKKIIYPTLSTQKIVENYFKISNFEVVNHIEFNRDIKTKPKLFRKKSIYKIGSIGAIGKEKGSERLQDLANLSIKIKQENIKFEFVLIGYANKPLKNILLTGEYEEKFVKQLISDNNLDVLLFTANWPETYSYTLSYALESGLPIIAPDIGCFPERLKGRNNTLLFDFNQNPESLMDDIKLFILELEKNTSFENINHKINHNCNFYLDKYSDLIIPKIGNKSKVKKLLYNVKNDGIKKNTKENLISKFIINFLWKLSYLSIFKKLRSKKYSKLRKKVKNIINS